MTQCERQVLWVVDIQGNAGKSFLGNYLNILYNFLLLDGTMTVRDVALFFQTKYKGVCLDVPRAALKEFNYDALEAFKNGYMTSGKYAGRAIRFNPLRVIVFSNDHPDYGKLSADRWDVLSVGTGVLENQSRMGVVNPQREFPFILPIEPPVLSEDFNLREFVCTHIPMYRQNPAANLVSLISIFNKWL